MYRDIDRGSIMKLNKKGVSPVIAVLLLIVIAVAAAILTYLWITGYIGTVQQAGGTGQLQEKIKIEGVDYSAGTVTVYIRNVGDVDLTVDALYVYDATGTIVGTPSTGLGLSLDPGDVGSGTVSATLTAGNTYTIKAVTLRGTEATYVFTYRE